MFGNGARKPYSPLPLGVHLRGYPPGFSTALETLWFTLPRTNRMRAGHNAIMLTIRPAEIDDAPAIARVHVETWRWSYRGIVPEAYLDSTTVQNRAFVWAHLLARRGAERR